MNARVASASLAFPRRAATCTAPLLVFAATLLLYLSTLTQVHTFDALSYITSVEAKPWTEVFHPHHLAYGPLGELALWIGHMLGYAGGAAVPMQVVNALAGAAGVAYFFVLVRRVTARSDLALAAAVLLGGAYAFWYYAVEVEVYTVAALFLLLCLGVVLDLLERSSGGRLALLGLAQGGAVLFHQTNVLLCAPILMCFVYDVLRHRPADRMRVVGRWLIYVLVLALLVGLPYLFVAWISGFRSWNDFSAWLTEYARTGWWGGPITPQKWADLGTGIAETLAQPGGALLWLLLAGVLLLHGRNIWRRARVLALVLAGWLAVYGGFFFWWEPDNIEFWIASIAPAVLLLALALRGQRRWGPGVLLVLALALTTGVVNHASIQRRGDAATDLQRTIARGLAAQSTPADLLLIPDGLLELYLPYYQTRDQFLSLNQALFDSGNDWNAACTAIQAKIDTAQHAGATAIIADEVFHPPALLLSRHQITAAQVDACLARYQPELLPVAMPSVAPSYWRLPRGTERAAGAGWQFSHEAQGWQATNLTDSMIGDGWHGVPQSDPYFTGPLLDLDASRYRAIEIQLANSTRARDAQVFYAGLDQQITEARSVRWTLEPGSQMQTYTIPLDAAAGWDGTITRLRIDPVGVGDGGALVLGSVRLVQK